MVSGSCRSSPVGVRPLGCFAPEEVDGRCVGDAVLSTEGVFGRASVEFLRALGCTRSSLVPLVLF